ncbi:MAG: glycosyltransferase, partial [Deltaproteobacteria bacterium]|nr:glycosyltransferase [Deltaproteobacteria bacterium]
MRRLRRPRAPIKSILMTADTIGGVWTYSIELARALSASGITVYLATMGEAPSEAQRKEAKAAGNIKLFESSFKLEWMEDPWADVEKSGEWLLLLEAELCPDIVHLNGYCHGASAFKAPVLITAHSCVLSWWAAVKGGTAPPSWERYREEVARGLWSADMIVAPTNAMLSAIYGNYFVRASCRVIHNG